MKKCDKILKKTFELASMMLDLADEGDNAREDPGCGILYGVVRDSAYKIRQLADTEMKEHIKKGWLKGGK